MRRVRLYRLERRPRELEREGGALLGHQLQNVLEVAARSKVGEAAPLQLVEAVLHRRVVPVAQHRRRREPPLRLVLVQALILVRNRGLMEPLELFKLLFGLFR